MRETKWLGSYYLAAVGGLIALLALLANSAAAATYTWNNAGTDWNTAADWSPGTAVPGAGDLVRFTSASYTNQPNLSSPSSVTGIWSTGAGSVAIGGAVTLTTLPATINGNASTALEMDSGAGSLTINAPLALGAAETWLNNASSGALTVANSVNNGGFLLTASGSGGSFVSGIIGGAGGLTKAGSGTLTLSNSNTFTGVTTIGGGVLSVNSIGDGGVASAIGASPVAKANLIIGGTLQYTGPSANTNRNFNLSSGTDTISITQPGTTLNFDSFNGSGLSSASEFVKSGPGELEVTYGTTGNGFVSQVGGIVVSGGTFTTPSAHSVQLNVTSTSGVQVASGATLGTIVSIEDDNNNTNQNFYFSGSSGTATSTGQLIVVFAASSSYTQTKSFTVDSGVTGLITGSMIPFDNSLSSQSTLTIAKSGNGLLVLAAADSVICPYTILGGTLQIGSGGNAGSIINSSSATIADSATLAFARSDTMTFGNTISGTGGIAQLGPGTTVLSPGAPGNTYTGPTVVSGGTLQLSGAAALGSGALSLGAGTLDFNGNSYGVSALSGTAGLITDTSSGAGTSTLTVNQNPTTTYSGALLDGANKFLALTKAGTGSLTLAGNLAYSGPTTVSAGTLAVNQPLYSGTTVTVGGGANLAAGGGLTIAGTLTGLGAVSAGTTTLASGGLLSPGATAGLNNIGTLSLAHLATAGGATIAYDLSSSTTAGSGVNDLVSVAGNLSFGGNTTVAINSTGGYLAYGQYTLMTYGGSLSGYNAGSLVLANAGVLNARQSYQFDGTSTPGVIYFDVLGQAANLTWVGSNGASWDNSGSTSNWYNTGISGNDQFVSGDNISFTTTNSGSVALNAAVIPGSVTVSGSYTFSGSGKITGPGALTVESPAALVIATTNDFTGGTNLQGGTISLGINNALPVAGTLTLGTSGSAGTFDLAGYNQTIGGLATGAGATAQGQIITASSGSSSLSFSGGTSSSVFAGVITDTATTTGGTLGLHVASGTLNVSAAATTYAGATTVNSGLLLAGALPNTSGISVNGGSLSVATYNGSASLTVAGGGAANISGTNLTLPAVSNSGRVAFSGGSGTISLGNLGGSGTTSFAAGANVASITGGAVQFNGPAAVGTLSGGSATFSNPAAQITSLGNASATVANGVSLTVSGGTQTSGSIAGQGGLTVPGPGLVVLASSESYTGGTTVSGGTLQFGSGASGGDGSIASPSIANNSALAFNTFANQTYAGAINGSGGLTKLGAGALLLSGTNTYSGPTVISAGTLRLATILPNAPLAFTFSSGTDANNGTTAATLTNSGAPVYSYTGGPEPGLGTMTLGGANYLDIQAASLPNLSGSASYTVAMWIKTTEQGAALLNKGDTAWNPNDETFYLTNASGNGSNSLGGTHMGGVQNSGSWIGGNTAVNTGAWTFVSVVRSGGTATIYVNGVADGTATNMANVEQGTQDIRLGWTTGHDGSAMFNGQMSGVYVYNSALTAAQLQTLMTSGLGTGGTLPVNSAVQLTNAGAALDINGTTQNIPSLNGVAGTSVYLGNGSLTVGSDGSNSTYSGVISDRGGANTGVGGMLTKTGGGLFVLTGANLYAGSTTISGGTLQLGSGQSGQDGSISSTAAVVNNAALAYDLAGTQVAGYNIGGFGSLTEAGSGTLVLGSLSSVTTSTNSFTGNITIDGGTMVVAALSNGSSSALGLESNSRTITVNAGGTLQFDAPNTLGPAFNSITAPTLMIGGGTVTNADPYGSGAINNALNNVVLANGVLTATTGEHFGYAAWNVNGTITSTGNSLISTSDPVNGTLMLDGQSPYSTPFDVTDGTLTVSAPVVQDNVDGIVDQLLKTGAGTLVLSASDNYNGGTVVAEGTLIAANEEALADGSSLIVGDASAFIDSPAAAAAAGAAIAAVPEPGTLALVGFALCGAAVFRRVRRLGGRKDSAGHARK